MFVHSSEMLALSAAGHQSFCASLNTPVVDIAQLPPGPARAALLIHRDPDRATGLAIGLRALESGRVALFRYEGPLAGEQDLVRAVEYAVSFVEELGFLFDADTVMEKLRKADAKALKRWTALMGEAGPDEGLPSVMGEGDLMPPPETAAPPLEAARLETAGDADPDAPTRGLSRFREAAADSTAADDRPPADELQAGADDESGSQALGRIPIVKRRVDAEATERGWWMRLLGSF